MHFWGAEYAAQGGGCMDFWDGLEEGRKRRCRELVTRLGTARDEAFSETRK